MMWPWLIQGIIIGYCLHALVTWAERRKQPQNITLVLPRSNGLQWYSVQDRAKTSNTWSNEVNDIMGR